MRSFKLIFLNLIQFMELLTIAHYWLIRNMIYNMLYVIGLYMKHFYHKQQKLLCYSGHTQPENHSGYS